MQLFIAQLPRVGEEAPFFKGARALPTQLFSRVATGRFSVTIASIHLEQELY